MKGRAIWVWAILLGSSLASAGALAPAFALPPAAPAGAAPAVTLGEDCRQAAQDEAAAGAKPKFDPERMLSNGYLLFTDSQPALSRDILYRCSTAGTVGGYLQTLSTPSEALAFGAFADTKMRMQSRFGPPQQDSETAILPRRIAFWKAYSGTFSAHEAAEWRRDHESISVTLQKPRDNQSWQVITRDQVPTAAAGAPTMSSRLVGSAATVALSSAAIVAALCLTPLRRFRALLAAATPLALAFELQLSAPVISSPAGNIASWPMLDIAVSFAAGILACSMVVWLVGRHSSLGSSKTVASAQRWPLLLGLVSLGAFFAYLRWLFRPGHDPASLLGGAGLFVLAPASLLLAAVLLYVGTSRLLCAPRSEGGGLEPWVLEVAGVLGNVAALTLCLNFLAEFALRL